MGKYEAGRKQSTQATTKVDITQTRAAARKRPTPQQRRKSKQDQRIVIIAVCAVLLVVLIGLIIGMIAYSNRSTDDGKILPNVYAAGIDLGGMTPDEAASALHLATDLTFSQKDMVVLLPDSRLTLSPSQTKASLDVDAVVTAAYGYGRGGSKDDYEQAREKAATSTYTIALLPYMELDLHHIQTEIQSFCDSYGSHMTQPSATLEGSRPAYDPEYPDLPVTHQTLIVTMGTPEYVLSADDLYDRVLDAYSLNQLTLEYEAPDRTDPAVPDAQKLFDQYCVPAADAVIDAVTYQVTPEVYGYGFSVDELQGMIDAADHGQTVQIQLDFLLPQITAEELTQDLFVDLLSTYTAADPSGGSDDRNQNLALSCQALNGTVIQIGGEFSFNDLIGRPTAQKGYRQVTEYRGTSQVQVLGGGISQTASALYYCALMADLEILERHSNTYAPAYIAPGLDSCIEWDTKDLRLRNNTGAPIQILATANGSEVTITLLGTDDRDYRVEIHAQIVGEMAPETVYQVVDENNIYDYTDGQILQEGITGYEVQTSIDKIDKESGEILSSTLVDSTTYSKRDQIVVAIGAEPDPTEPSDPTEDPGESPNGDPTESSGFSFDDILDIFG